MSLTAGVLRGEHCSNITSNMEGYFKQEYPQLFYFARYPGITQAFLLEIFKFYCLFVWNYMLIICLIVGYGLTAKFKNFNAYLQMFKGKVIQSVIHFIDLFIILLLI